MEVYYRLRQRLAVFKPIDTTPHLRHLATLEKLLKHYKPSKQTIITLQDTPVVTMVAPTASGRNTIIKELLKTGNYYFIVSDTSRPRRNNNGVWERNGVEYFFRSEEAIIKDIRAGHYIEAEIIHGQQVSGISGREIEKAHKEGKVAITDVDILGGINMARLKPDSSTICVLPPSFDEWQSRISGRGRFEPIELYRRLKTALKLLSMALKNDHFIFVINDDLSTAVKTVDQIARQGIHNKEAEKDAHKIAEDLYNKTLEYLKANAKPEFTKGFAPF